MRKKLPLVDSSPPCVVCTSNNNGKLKLKLNPDYD